MTAAGRRSTRPASRTPEAAPWAASASGTGAHGPAWEAVHDSTYALAGFDDGSGEALYVGGRFTVAGGVVVNSVAKWDGQSWFALGGGVGGSPGGSFSFPAVDALAVFDDGAGAALYAGGSFLTAGGVAANHVAKWDGTTWSALAGGVAAPGTPVVKALAVFDDGTGPALYAGGYFSSAGGVSVSDIAKWNGTAWSSPGSGVSGGTVEVNGTSGVICALTPYDDGAGPGLHAGGLFNVAGGVGAGNIAKWSAGGWSAIGNGLNADVRALTTFDDGSGPALYAGGYFKYAGGEVNSIAKWDGQAWSSLGGGLAGYPTTAVNALAVFDDGSGPALYAGGAFYAAGGVPAVDVAKWDGTSWSGLGNGPGAWVFSLLHFDDGSGPALYAGCGLGGPGVARWDGTSWSAVGGGVGGIVRALEAFDGGSGPALFAGGQFTTAGGAPASFVARWDGASWSAVGGGMDNYVEAFAVFAGGGEARLYAGGVFATAGGVPAGSLARWDGTSWSAVGAWSGSQVHALAVHNDGGGRALYVAGAGAEISRWDGTTWTQLGGGANGGVFSLAAHDDGDGLALYAGGNFTASPAGDSFLAKWGCGAITSLSGCGVNAATLEALVSSAPLGAPLPLRITGTAAVSGSAQLYLGRSGVDAGGCGLRVPGLGELLLAPAPAPVLAASGALAGGVCDMAPSVPSTPALAGLTAYLQGFALDLALAGWIEPTNALAVTLGP
jgi:hypothetical protein